MGTITAIEYEPVIGLEVHAQLLTKSKMFCGCAADYVQASPNTRVCPVCLGLPGVLPVINKRAVEYVIMTGLALHSTISEYTKFDRKNYPYPDLMKGYQISQYDLPICLGGYLEIDVDGQRRCINMTRVHLEEDVAKLQHRTDPVTGEPHSLVDVNRSGMPLMEIVGEPELRSSEEARQYLMKLRTILRYLGVSTGNMEEGSFRCDANISIRPKGSTELSTRVEVKNMNSFRAVYRALQHEVERQTQVLQGGGRIVQETRGWAEEKGQTIPQRTKEYAHDYRYFPEPDLPPLAIGQAWVEEIRSRLPEMPDAKRARFMEASGLPSYDASLLTVSKATAHFFEATVGQRPLEGEALLKRAKSISNWVLGDLTRLLNATGQEIGESRVRPEHLSQLLDLQDEGHINMPTAKTVLEEMFQTGKAPLAIVEEKGLTQITDVSTMVEAVLTAIAENPKPVEDYLKGKETAIKFLVGQVMKATEGKANPATVGNLCKISLVSVWKSISFPGNSVARNINVVFGESSEVSTVLTYEANGSNGPWLVAIRNPTTSKFEGTLTTVIGTHAYWINATTFEPVSTILAEEPPSHLPPSIPIISGWNLVPVSDLEKRAVGTKLNADTYFSHLEWTMAYHYDTSANSWKKIVKDDCSMVRTGEGWWLFARKKGELVP